MKLKLGYRNPINVKLIASITQHSPHTAKIRFWTGNAIIVRLHTSVRRMGEYTFNGSLEQLKESVKRLKSKQ